MKCARGWEKGVMQVRMSEIAHLILVLQNLILVLQNARLTECSLLPASYVRVGHRKGINS